MADKITNKSILDLAVKKSPVSRRDVEGVDADGKKTEDKKQFNGFLQTFLGKDRKSQSRTGQTNNRLHNDVFSNKHSQKGKNNKAYETGNSRDKDNDFSGFDKWKETADDALPDSSKPEKDSIREKAISRRAVEKAAAADEYFGFGYEFFAGLGLFTGQIASETTMPVDPEVAKAAEEAAQIIWNYLFPSGTPGQSVGAGEEGAAPNPLAEAASYIESLLQGNGGKERGSQGAALSELGAGTVAGESLSGAVETTNVSAEMNIDAVLAALEDLLDGVPRQALVDALAKTAEASGAGAESLEKIAAALGLDSLTVATGEETLDGDDLLASLDKGRLDALTGEADVAPESEGAVVASEDAEAAEERSTSAENAVAGKKQDDINGRLAEVLKKIFKETSADLPISNIAVQAGVAETELPGGFLNWLSDMGITLNVRGLFEGETDPTTVLTKLDTFLAAHGENLTQDAQQNISQLRKDLESVLQSTLAKPDGTTGKTVLGAELAKAVGEAAVNSASGATSASATIGKDQVPGQNGMVLPVGATAKSAEQAVLAGGDGESLLAGRENNQVAAAQSGQAGSVTNGKPLAPGGATNPVLDQIANIERLTEMMRLSNRRGVTNLTMQLSPPELGKVTVRVEAKNGVISALFRVEQAESAAQLQNGMQQLKESLKAHGLELSHVDIAQENYTAGGEGGGQGRYAGEAGERRGGSGRHDKGGVDALNGEETATRVREPGNPPGGLNLIA